MPTDDKDAVVIMYYDPEKKILICPDHASKLKEKLIQLAARKNSVCYYCYNEKKSGSLRIV